MCALEGQEAARRPRQGSEAGDAIVPFLLGHALLGPPTVQTEDLGLGHTGPVEVVGQVGRSDEMANIVPASVAPIDSAHVTVVQQGQRPAVGGADRRGNGCPRRGSVGSL